MIPNNPATPYLSPKGRTFHVIGLEKLVHTAKWIDRTEKHHWRVYVKFQDTKECKALVYDYHEKLIRIEDI